MGAKGDGFEVTSDPDMSIFEFGSDIHDMSAVCDVMDDRGWKLDRQQGGLHLMVSPGHLAVVDAGRAPHYDLRKLQDSGTEGARSEQEAIRFVGHEGNIWAGNFSPDDRLALTGGDDGKARLWEAMTGREVRQFVGHSGPVRSVAFSPDGRRVASGAGFVESAVRLSAVWFCWEG